ncbi:hypothetical protein ACFGOO_00970 [Treponema vincentii]|uniref:hypothetical protein n=1 Tax=Treponema vincentii TaxID=69710 RepID=UPI0035F55496
MDKFIAAYRPNHALKVKVALYISLCINTAYYLFTAACGLLYHSWWFGTLAFYYGILGLERFFLAKTLWTKILNRETEYRKSGQCGFMLLILTVGLIGRIIFITHDNLTASYSGRIVYGVAAYTFYAVISSIINLIKHKRSNSPIFTACRILTAASALVSLYSLQTALLTQFKNDEAFKQRMNAITGTAICAVIFYDSRIYDHQRCNQL